MKHKILILAAFYFVSSCLQSQNKTLDSLKVLLTANPHDTLKVKFYAELSDLCSPEDIINYTEPGINTGERILKIAPKNSTIFRFVSQYQSDLYNNTGFYFTEKSDYKEALKYYTKSLKVLSDINYQTGMSTALNNIAYVNELLGNTANCLDSYLKSLSIMNQVGDTRGISTICNNIAVIYYNQGNIERSLFYNNKCLKIKEELNDKKGVAQSLNNIGLIYSEQNDNKTALDYYARALALRKEERDKKGVAGSYINIGSCYIRQQQYDTVLYFFNAAYQLLKEVGDRSGMATCINNIGTVYQRTGNYEKALQNYKLGLRIEEETGNVSGYEHKLYGISSVLVASGKIREALPYALRCLEVARKLRYPSEIRDAAYILGTIHQKLGDYRHALECREIFVTMRDSVNNLQTKKITIRNQFQSEYDKKEVKIKTVALAEKEKLLLQATQERKQKMLIRYVILTVLIFVCVFSFFLFRSLKENKKKNAIITSQKNILDQKQKEIIDSIEYAKRIQNVLLTSEFYIHRHISRLSNDV